MNHELTDFFNNKIVKGKEKFLKEINYNLTPEKFVTLMSNYSNMFVAQNWTYVFSDFSLITRSIVLSYDDLVIVKNIIDLGVEPQQNNHKFSFNSFDIDDNYHIFEGYVFIESLIVNSIVNTDYHGEVLVTKMIVNSIPTFIQKWLVKQIVCDHNYSHIRNIGYKYLYENRFNLNTELIQWIEEYTNRFIEVSVIHSSIILGKKLELLVNDYGSKGLLLRTNYIDNSFNDIQKLFDDEFIKKYYWEFDFEFDKVCSSEMLEFLFQIQQVRDKLISNLNKTIIKNVLPYITHEIANFIFDNLQDNKKELFIKEVIDYRKDLVEFNRRFIAEPTDLV